MKFGTCLVLSSFVFVCATGCAHRPTNDPRTSITSTAPALASFEPHRVTYDGKLVELASIEFEGNVHVTSDVLRDRVDAARSADISDDTLWRDGLVVAQFYADNGFVAAKVDPVETSIDASGKLTLRWRVSEGEQYFLSRFFVFEQTSGADAPPIAGWSVPAELQNALYSRREITVALTSLTHTYHDAGYAFVEAISHMRVDDERRTVEVYIPIVRGPLVHVTKIEIEGNKRIDDETIRAALLLHEGDLYSETKLLLSRKRLKETQWFDLINISTAKASGEGAISVKFELTESARVAPLTAER